MGMTPRGFFTVRATGLTLLADAGDFFHLRRAAGVAALIHEIRVWQRGSNTLAMGEFTLRRGTTAGSGGTGLTEQEYDTGGTNPAWTAFSLPTTDITVLDLQVGLGFNNLQQAVWLPTPKIQIPLRAGHDFGIGQEGGIAHTNVGVQVSWEEFTI